MVQKMKHKHFNTDMILTKDDEQNFKNPDKYYICNTKWSVTYEVIPYLIYIKIKFLPFSLKN